jgi:hypothetical protein
MTKIFKIFAEFYELMLTARKDDRSSRAVSTGSLKSENTADCTPKILLNFIQPV